MTEPSTQALLDERYGTKRSRRFDKPFAWATGGALVLAGLVFLLFSGWQEGKDLEFKDLHYTVLDESTVNVDMQITAPADTTIICAVEALNTSHSTVGWKTVRVPENGDRTRRFNVDVTTTSLATTGRVRECWTPEEG